jgi:uncharacterized protein with ParB-like and HNH nuclease domain
LTCRYFKDPENELSPEGLLKFLLNKVLFIYVSTQDLEDAFRLFTILNDRGVPLRNSDILKSLNLGALEKEADKTLTQSSGKTRKVNSAMTLAAF